MVVQDWQLAAQGQEARGDQDKITRPADQRKIDIKHQKRHEKFATD